MLAEPVAVAPSLPRLRRPARGTILWLVLGLAVVIGAVVWVGVTGMRPAYDAYGWLVWGHQALHLGLDLNAAPSWKPLTFIFTLPYTLAGRTAVWLWMVTAVAGAFAAPVFGARVAYRLADPRRSRIGAAFAAAFAGFGVIGIAGFWHFLLIADSDPMMVALLLAAIDRHLCRHRGQAWILLVLLALGRPEAWVITAAYAVWAWYREPRMRGALLAGVGAMIILWPVMSRLSSPHWFVANAVDRRTTDPLPGNGIVAVMNSYFGLYELPVQLAGAVALAYAAVRRETQWLVLGAVVVVWIGVDIVLDLRGLKVSPRYMFEPAGVMVVLAGAAGGRLLSSGPRPVRMLAAAAFIVFAVAMAPQARSRARVTHNGIELGRTWALVIHRLQRAVDHAQARRILACGRPMTTVPFQSIVAWELGVNVAVVRSEPSLWLPTKARLVYFEPYYAGWRIHPVHAGGRACAGLTINTPSGGGTPLASQLQ